MVSVPCPTQAFLWQSSLLLSLIASFSTSLRSKLPHGVEAELEASPPPFACYQTMKQTG